MLDEPKELTAEQVAKEMQVHISRVYKWIQTGELPAIDIGSGGSITIGLVAPTLMILKGAGGQHRKTLRTHKKFNLIHPN